jgi:predicted nucleic acid-binding protein
MSCTFDTNILVYTLGQPADVKRQRAQSLIIRGARRQTAVLLLQSLAEFSYVATRKFGSASLRCVGA